MKKYIIKISSGSNPPGQAPYFVTPSPFDDVRTRKYETKEEFEQAMIQHIVESKQAGVENVLKQLNQKGFIINEVELTEESAKSLGWI